MKSSSGSAKRFCSWCREPIPKSARADAVYCSQSCRQSRFRLRRRHDGFETPTPGPGACRFAYADPPYPGTAEKYYATEPTYAGEVDHPWLVGMLEQRRIGDVRCEASRLHGWALSTSAKALRYVLALCPPDARVCSWVKPIGTSRKTWGMHNAWEPLIVVGGRPMRGGVRDFLIAQPARRGGTLPGRKPLAFCAWLFACLGMQPGDVLDDIYPGTGIVSRAWRELSRT